MSNEMKSLTLNGKTYDSFPDKKAVKSINGTTPDENGNVQIETSETGGLTDTARVLLMTVLRNGVYTSDQSANLTALEEALQSSGGSDTGGDDSGDTEVTLVSISATYSGGSVTAGTAVTDLTGIVVTATYSDGSTATVTDYTLSGTIAEGSNTITVAYGGKTTTFTVTGVSEPGDIETVEYALTPVFSGNSYPDKTTYETTPRDMSSGSAATVYVQSVLFEQPPVSGGVLHVTLDTTRLTYYKLRIYLVDADGNPYRNNSTLGATPASTTDGPRSGDITDDITWVEPGTGVGIMHINGTVICEIPDGYTVKWLYVDFDGSNVNNGTYLLDEELLAYEKPIYALVDKIVFDGEVITAKIVKEV